MNAPAQAPRHAERIQHVLTPAGIEAWLVEDYATPIVALDFVIDGGGRQDPIGKAGSMAFLAGMLDEGAGSLDSEAFHRMLDDHAIYLSFDADRDSFSGHLRTLTRHCDKAFESMAMAINEPRFDGDSLARVKGQMIANLKRDANEPDSVAARAWRRTAYPGHPYARSSEGELGETETIERDDLIRLHQAQLTRKTLKIAVVGAINAQKLSHLLDQAFANLPKATGLITPAVPPLVAIGKKILVDLDVPQASIRFGRPSLDRHDPDFMAAHTVNHILGGGSFTARLFREVREKRGLAYSVYSTLTTSGLRPLLLGATSTKNERALESLKVIEEQCADLAANGPTAEEVEKAKQYLIGSYALRFDTSTKIASHLTQLQREGFDSGYLDRRNALVAAVTLEDCQRAAKRLIGDGAFLVSIAGKPDGARENGFETLP